MKISIENLAENSEFIINELAKKGITGEEINSFKSAMLSRIETYECDGNDTVEFEIGMIIDEIFRTQFSDAAKSRQKKDANPKSLRNIMSSLHDGETYDPISKIYRKDYL